MIQSNGRYKDSTVATVNVASYPRQVIVSGPQSAYTFNYQTYMWTANDRLDMLATSAYGSPLQWWAIADANPEILDFSTLAPGQIIRIPNL